MKDFYYSNYNLEARLIQKGMLDLKAFWQFIEEKHFKPPEHKNINLVSQINQILIKISEHSLLDKRDAKEGQNLVKFYEELHQDPARLSKTKNMVLIIYYINYTLNYSTFNI